MTVKGYEKRSRGFTLLEIMVAMAILSIAVIGAIGFRYHSALDARKADVQITASRLGSALLDDWKGNGSGSASYNPVTQFSSNLSISTSGSGPAVPSGFSSLGTYLVTANSVNYYVTMSYKAASATEPRTLNVCAAWLSGYGMGTIAGTDPSIRLTTYVN